MTFLGRLLIVLSFALLSMQGAWAHGMSAHERVAPSVSSHCETMAAGALPCHHEHGHCSCCDVVCTVHCAVLLSAWRFEPRAFGATLPPPFAELRRDGLTHAPPVPPPIV